MQSIRRLHHRPSLSQRNNLHQLLTHADSFALPWEQRGDADPQATAVAAFPAQLDSLTDVPATD